MRQEAPGWKGWQVHQRLLTGSNGAQDETAVGVAEWLERPT